MVDKPVTEATPETHEDDLLRNHRELQRLFDQVEVAKTEWERTMDCVPMMVVLTNNSGSVQRCNKSLADYLHKDYYEIIGRNWALLLSERGLPINSSQGSTRTIHEESSDKWYELKMHPYTSKGKIPSSGHVITITDITIQKKFAEQLEEKNHQIMVNLCELNNKNAELAEAYAALKTTQSQVLQQEKMASIGQLAAGVAHEINNPIGFITSNLNSLGKYLTRMSDFIQLQSKALASPGDPLLLEEVRQKEKTLKMNFILNDSLKIIEESLDGSERVQKIVQSLKSFSRSDDGKRVSADVNECFESAVNIVWNEIKYKAALVRELGVLPPTLCYPSQLNQVFMNILINAVHAIENQGTITVRTWHDDGSIWASVSDTGHGIPPEAVSRIFEPFFTTKEVGKGTGLGLSISYEVIKRHEGDIWVESTPGEGTTFTIRIPVIEAG
ncbi:MAG: PAS domain-containing sensor histidine kinase [Deltaproteobacteria bacterium]|nr:PAS domain-containing sensor histidine kinase [Deltaproteobacteria bacterium]TLN03144.1 MAG: peptidylprolyl isomerase [bacterium]